MTAVLNVAAVAIALITGLLWLVLDRAEQRRRRRWEEHTEQALRVAARVSPNHPSVWRRDDHG